jgi:hypothetical protein
MRCSSFLLRFGMLQPTSPTFSPDELRQLLSGSATRRVRGIGIAAPSSSTAAPSITCFIPPRLTAALSQPTLLQPSLISELHTLDLDQTNNIDIWVCRALCCCELVRPPSQPATIPPSCTWPGPSHCPWRPSPCAVSYSRTVHALQLLSLAPVIIVVAALHPVLPPHNQAAWVDFCKPAAPDKLNVSYVQS